MSVLYIMIGSRPTFGRGRRPRSCSIKFYEVGDELLGLGREAVERSFPPDRSPAATCNREMSELRSTAAET